MKVDQDIIAVAVPASGSVPGIELILLANFDPAAEFGMLTRLLADELGHLAALAINNNLHAGEDRMQFDGEFMPLLISKGHLSPADRWLVFPNSDRCTSPAVCRAAIG